MGLTGKAEDVKFPAIKSEGKAIGPLIDGVLVINKERGWTSNDVVQKVKGMLKARKVGHTGTLDPDAEGVLPICIGKATKLSSRFVNTDKVYKCVLRLGIETDTEDLTGKVINKANDTDLETLDYDKVKQAILSFIGDYDQVPPMYSAKKVGGKKLYDLARSGIEIERKPSKVYIASIDNIEFLARDIQRISFIVSCSKGTYIRSLCRDIGKKLIVGGTMESLVRMRTGPFTIEDSLKISEAQALLSEGLLEDRILTMGQLSELIQ